MNTYGLNSNEYDDSVAEIKQLGMITLNGNRAIHPFSLKMNVLLELKCRASYEFRAMTWDELIDDVVRESVRSNMCQKYTYTAKLLVHTLNKTKEIK